MIILLIVSCFLFILIKKWPDQQLHLVFCDVGQGDAILIFKGNFQMLIDAGPDEKVINCLDKYIPFWDRSLEYLVATHPDYDHVGGLPLVLKRFDIQNFVTSGIDGKNPSNFGIVSPLLEKINGGTTPIPITDDYTLSLLGNLHMVMMVPGRVKTENTMGHRTLSETGLWDLIEEDNTPLPPDNDLSIGIFLEYFETRVLLMSDIEGESELALTKKPLIKDVNIIKVGHHGAKTSSSMELLTKTTPEIGVISVGKNNRYNHPHPQVMKNLEEIGAEIYRTDVYGDVEVVINESGYYLN